MGTLHSLKQSRSYDYQVLYRSNRIFCTNFIRIKDFSSIIIVFNSILSCLLAFFLLLGFWLIKEFLLYSIRYDN